MLHHARQGWRWGVGRFVRAELQAAGGFHRRGAQWELSGCDTVTPSGWIAANALMAASDSRLADEFWEAVGERGVLCRR